MGEAWGEELQREDRIGNRHSLAISMFVAPVLARTAAADAPPAQCRRAHLIDGRGSGPVYPALGEEHEHGPEACTARKKTELRLVPLAYATF